MGGSVTVNRGAIDANIAGIRRKQPDDEIKQRALAASRRSQHGDKLAGGRFQVNAGQDVERRAAAAK